MDCGFKLIENENGVFLTYVLSGGIKCENKGTLAVADALNNIAKTITEQMREYIDTFPIKKDILNDVIQRIKANKNEGTEI